MDRQLTTSPRRYPAWQDKKSHHFQIFHAHYNPHKTHPSSPKPRWCTCTHLSTLTHLRPQKLFSARRPIVLAFLFKLENEREYEYSEEWMKNCIAMTTVCTSRKRLSVLRQLSDLSRPQLNKDFRLLFISFMSVKTWMPDCQMYKCYHQSLLLDKKLTFKRLEFWQLM